MEYISIWNVSESESKTRVAEAVKKVFGDPRSADPYMARSAEGVFRSLLEARTEPVPVPFPGARSKREHSAPAKGVEEPAQSSWSDPAAIKKILADTIAAQSAQPITPVTVDFSKSRIGPIRETTTRREEFIREERRIIDHSRTSASAVETIGLTHTAEWDVTIDTSHVRALAGNIQLNAVGLGSVRGNIAKTLTRRYSTTWKQSISHQQSTTVNVPAGKKVQLIIRWKRIWQQGEVTLRARDGHSATIPFEVTVALGFDTETVDLI
jgi:hypothetical protein